MSVNYHLSTGIFNRTNKYLNPMHVGWHKAFVSNNNYRLLRELMMKGKAAPCMKTRLAARNEERPMGVNEDCAKAQNEELALLVEWFSRSLGSAISKLVIRKS